MAFSIVGGPRVWEGSRDEEGYRTWKITHLVMTDDQADGPALALQTPGLPIPGSIWSFGNDLDVWATCKLGAEVKPYPSNKLPIMQYEITQTFSNKPDGKKCKDQQIEDPLLQPPKVSGNTQTYQEEATTDRFGNKIVNSAFEQIRGPQVEFDKNKHVVNIEMNVPELRMDFVLGFIDHVNETELWGNPPRTVKLTEWSWEVKYYGTCYKYYTWKFKFDVDLRTFDRQILDEGTKVLRGDWVRDPSSIRYTDYVSASDADPNNPSDFVKFKDWNGENSRVILNGAGVPIDTGIGTGTDSPLTEGIIAVEKYEEANMLLLGVPLTL